MRVSAIFMCLKFCRQYKLHFIPFFISEYNVTYIAKTIDQRFIFLLKNL